MIQSNSLNPLNNVNEYDFSALEEITQKQMTMSEVMKELTFYLLPIFGMLFFLFVFFNGLVPSINTMNEKLNQITELKKENEDLQERIRKIKLIQKNAEENQVLIDKINFLVPSGRTSVVGFGDKILNNVQILGLQYGDLSTGESELVDSSMYVNPGAKDELEKDPSYLPLNQLPTTIDIRGEYSSIREFFVKMYQTGEDFFVVNQMDLLKSGDKEWSGEISLAKYQFTPNANFDPVKAYFNISEDTQMDQEVLNFLKKKYINNAFEKAE